MSKTILGASLVAQMVKNLLAKQETQVRSLGQEDSLEKATNSKLLPGEFHGQRSLAGYSPWGCKDDGPEERVFKVMEKEKEKQDKKKNNISRRGMKADNKSKFKFVDC